jgi:hypothetical protein
LVANLNGIGHRGNKVGVVWEPCRLDKEKEMKTYFVDEEKEEWR